MESNCFEEFDLSAITDPNEKLDINQFELNAPKKSNTQKLFHHVLGTIINKYNKLGKEESKKEGIYYLKEKRILLANFGEEYIENYLKYNELFKGLMSREPNFFPLYDSSKGSNWSVSDKKIKYNETRTYYSNNSRNNGKNRSNYSNSNDNNNNKMSNRSLLFKNYYKKYNKEEADKHKEFLYYLNKFSSYFNGMFFESVATETFLSIIDKNYSSEDSQKNIISFLPRIMFYMEDKNKIKENKKYHGYNEIDCAFILKEKDKVEIPREMITCFKSFESSDEFQFYESNNIMENLTINKNDIVILEVKSKWMSLKGKENEEKNKDKIHEKEENKLVKFIKKSKRFIEHYEDLNIAEKNQQKVLIYLYNDSMHYNCVIEEENEEIRKAYKMIEKDANIRLYIAYFQSYLKVMGSYDRIKKMRSLNEKVKQQELKIGNLENEQKSMQGKLKNQEKNFKEQEKNFNEKLKNQEKNFKDQEKNFNEKLKNQEKNFKDQQKNFNEKLESQQKNFNEKLESQQKNFMDMLVIQEKNFEEKLKKIEEDLDKIMKEIKKLNAEKHESTKNSAQPSDEMKNDEDNSE